MRLSEMSERQIQAGVEARDNRLIDEMAEGDEREEGEEESPCPTCKRNTRGRCLGSDCPIR